MAGVRTTAGSTVGISAALPATEDAAGYAALTFTTVAELTNIGELGRTYNKTTHSPIGKRRIEKLRGSYDEGLLALQMGADISDAGQALLETARDDATDANYSFALTDKNGDIRYFQALVMDYKTNYGAADDVIGATSNVEINSDIVFVAAP